MRQLAIFLATAAIALIPIAANAASFGKPLQGLEAATLDKVLDAAESGQAVRLEGTVKAVCQNKGCWLELAQGERSVHVTFEGYSFFVPTESAGSKVVLEGKVMVKEPDPEVVAHLQAEGASDAAGSTVSIEATGVELTAAE